MSVRTPPKLQKLAIQALLRDEALAISSLEELPSVLFPALFKEAFTGRQTKLIKAIVAAWPFPCLPVGALMKRPDMEIFQALLNGVDMLLKREFYPRCLRTPLETLSIVHCQISQSDVDSFSCSQSLFQLKHLEIIEVTLDAFDLTHLRGLLERVVDSLGTLYLSSCKMKDSHINVLLPALTQCSQLTDVNFYYNDFSMPTLKDLLEHTVNWSKINVEQYPAPLECYDERNHVSRERFAQLCEELMDTLREVRQPKNISFATNTCPKCHDNYVYGHGAKLCDCWQ
ncbi:PRAME family member 12-like isoform X2 [Apodemus sylvaticus]|uniref:PRAME family member 12-like isoform X2 n=1 Tax=Apodemus sylvaticus TaxID=10129 RepID=UPI00224264AE|nr:PRAME family member 12-like isoform X2 [Apodemus sylvaticus]